MNLKTIGILGGMGPEATADLYLRIVRIFQREYGAKYDCDFPAFFIASVPIPDVVESVSRESEIVAMLVEGAKKLEASGASFIVIPCNSVHKYLQQLRQAVGIPVLSIMDETAQELSRKGFSRVTILGTELTVKNKLFELPCQEKGIEVVAVKPEEQREVTGCILAALSGKNGDRETTILNAIIANLVGRGAQAVVLGCTELPLMVNQENCKNTLVDTTEILARAAVRECRSNLY